MTDLNKAQYHKIYVGLTEADIELDMGRLKTIISAMLTQIGVGSSVQGLDEHIHEVTRHISCYLLRQQLTSYLQICRYGGAELHSVAAFLGGVVAHEVIKLVTGQYVPLDNMIIYNAVTSNVTTYKLE